MVVLKKIYLFIVNEWLMPGKKMDKICFWQRFPPWTLFYAKIEPKQRSGAE